MWERARLRMLHFLTLISFPKLAFQFNAIPLFLSFILSFLLSFLRIQLTRLFLVLYVFFLSSFRFLCFYFQLIFSLVFLFWGILFLGTCFFFLHFFFTSSSFPFSSSSSSSSCFYPLIFFWSYSSLSASSSSAFTYNNFVSTALNTPLSLHVLSEIRLCKLTALRLTLLMLFWPHLTVKMMQ